MATADRVLHLAPLSLRPSEWLDGLAGGPRAGSCAILRNQLAPQVEG